MCDFKPGDEIEKFRIGGGILTPFSLPVGTRATVAEIIRCPHWHCDGVRLVEFPDHGSGHAVLSWRKVQKRNDRLTIEAFLTIKPGQFEEPKRAPAKKRERVQ